MKRLILLLMVLFTNFVYAQAWTLDDMMRVKLIEAMALSSDGNQMVYVMDNYLHQNNNGRKEEHYL
jgi:hypothetical protein